MRHSHETHLVVVAWTRCEGQKKQGKPIFAWPYSAFERKVPTQHHPVQGLEFRPKAWCSEKNGSFEGLHEIATWCLPWERQFNSAFFFLTDLLIQSKAPIKLCGISSYLFPCRKAGLHPCISKETALLKSWLSCDLPSKSSFFSIKHPEQMTTIPRKFDPFSG